MVRAIVGANWGDEGKGKLTDMLAEKSDIVVRFQGGANAGHTIVNHYGKFALHTLPSGVFYDHTTNIIGNGVALNIPVFFNELKKVTSEGVPMPKILISDRAQMVMPYHVLFDQYEEERLGKASFGSTKSGIAPFYSDKYAKIGFQVQELLRKLSRQRSREFLKRRTFFLNTFIISLLSTLMSFSILLWSTRKWSLRMFATYLHSFGTLSKRARTFFLRVSLAH